MAPSALPHSEKWPVPKALERGEVKDLVQAWGNAARRAHEAGFDMLELHGAHGYLVDQFFWDKSNCCSCRRRTRSVYSPNAGSSTRYRVRSSSFRKAA